MPKKKEEIKEEVLEDITIEPEIPEEGSSSGFGTPKEKKLRADLKKATAEKQEYLAGWQRAKADLVNAKKDFDDQKKKIVSFANENMANEILPVLDSFEMAFSNKEAWEAIDENWRKGVEYIHTQLVGIMRDHGVEEIKTDGEVFDPILHISSDSIEGGVSGTIANTIQKGYKTKDGVVRPARVVVYE